MIDSFHCQRFFDGIMRAHVTVDRSWFINVQTNEIYAVSIACSFCSNILIILTILTFGKF